MQLNISLVIVVLSSISGQDELDMPPSLQPGSYFDLVIFEPK